jgi:glycosyltransferase involved in cell wall biosynthesis
MQNFKIIVPFYNCEKWIEKCIQSIKKQEYKNFHCYLIDDMSTDNSKQVALENIDKRFTYITNTEKKFKLRNFFECVHSFCEDEDVIVEVDGDDWLASSKVLTILNEKYNETGCWITYGSYVDYPSMKKGLYSQELPKDIVVARDYRNYRWSTSHLRTFKSFLFKKIKKEDLMINNVFFDTTSDLATMFPMLEMAGSKIEFVKNVMLFYNLTNDLNDHKRSPENQRKIDLLIRSKDKYEIMERI